MTDPSTTPHDHDAESLQNRSAELVDPTAEVEMIRHEQRLLVGVERFPLERVRLEKYIITEQQLIPVTIRREEVRLIREPLDPDAPIAATSPGHHRDPVVVILRQERPEIRMRIIPVEKVTLTTTVITEQRTVTDTVGYEQIDLITPID